MFVFAFYKTYLWSRPPDRSDLFSIVPQKQIDQIIFYLGRYQYVLIVKFNDLEI